MFLLLHQVRKAYRKESEDFGVHKGIFPYVISLSACVASECIHVRAYACASCALVHQVGRLCLKHFFASIKREKAEKRFPCALSGYFALNLIVYHLKHLNLLCAYTNKHGKISLLSVTL